MGDPREPDLSAVCAILERVGLAPDSIGLGSIAQAVRKRLQATGSTTPEEFAQRLSPGSPALEDLLDELVVPETWFFRDAAPFECLRNWAGHWRARSDGRVLRVLSAGCSTGEEAYSLAMTLFDAGLAPGQFRVVAADLSPRALDRARQALYGPSSFRQQDPELVALRDRCCDRSGARWRVKPELRSAVEFRGGNLTSPDFLASERSFPVIFCRNVLIYFHGEARRSALANLHRLLEQGGLLYCGHAESRIIAEGPFCRHGNGFLFAFCRDDDEPVTRSASTPARGGRLPAQEAGRRRHSLLASMTSIGDAGSNSPKKGVVRNPTSGATPSSTRPRPAIPAVPIRPVDADPAMLIAALEAADRGQLDEAERMCGRILAATPASADAYCLRGVLCQTRGAAADAQQNFERALYLNPRHYEALLHMMLLAEQRGEQAAAGNFRRRARQAAAGEES